jgi:DNA-binding MarR family transcriptional regulator
MGAKSAKPIAPTSSQRQIRFTGLRGSDPAMNQTQSALRLSTEHSTTPQEQPRIASSPLRRLESLALPPDTGTELPHVLRLHAPPAGRQTGSDASPPAVADRAAEEIVDGVLKAAHRLRGLLSGHFSEFDLTDVRFSVLRFLRDAEPQGCTQSEIAEHLDQSESSISTLVKRMRKSELLYRLRSGIDKRKWVLKLTDRGSSLLETARRCHAERMDQFLRAFDSEERLNLTGMLSKLVAELSPEETVPAPVVERAPESLSTEPPGSSPIGSATDVAAAVVDDVSTATAGEAPAA